MSITPEDAIRIPIKHVLEGRIFEGPTKESALRSLLDNGFEPVYMPGIVGGRNEYSPEESPGNWLWLHAPSIKATGRTKAGTPVVVYVHVPNYFSNPDNIAEAARQGFINGAGIMPDDEFWQLVDLAEEQEGKTGQMVFKVDYRALLKSISGLVKVKDALKHPQTAPFLGGQELAEKYLQLHEKLLGKRIGIWHFDDLAEHALGHVLGLGDYRSSGLLSDSDFGSVARFVGVIEGAKGAAQRKVELESILTT